MRFRDWLESRTGFKVGIGTGLKTVVDSAGDLYQAGVEITATAVELNQYVLTATFADANTAGDVYIAVPHAGTIDRISVVPHVANTTAATGFTGSLAGVAITHGALQIAAAGAAGTAATIVPSAANTVAANDVIKIASDGGGLPAMPVTVTVTITR